MIARTNKNMHAYNVYLLSYFIKTVLLLLWIENCHRAQTQKRIRIPKHMLYTHHFVCLCLSWCKKTLNLYSNQNSVCVYLILMRSFGDAIQGDRQKRHNKQKQRINVDFHFCISFHLACIDMWYSYLTIVSSHWSRFCHKKKPAEKKMRPIGKIKCSDDFEKKRDYLSIAVHEMNSHVSKIQCVYYTKVPNENDSNDMEWQMKRCTLNALKLDGFKENKKNTYQIDESFNIYRNRVLHSFSIQVIRFIVSQLIEDQSFLISFRLHWFFFWFFFAYYFFCCPAETKIN